MPVIGLTLVRDEALILHETLDHFGALCGGGLYVLDDCSDDGTFDLARAHPAVRRCLRNDYHDPNWAVAQTAHRQRIFDVAARDARAGDWFLYFDADERVEYDPARLAELPGAVTCVFMRLFDFYITPQDRDRPYAGSLPALRDWCGPEYRPILFLFRHQPGRRWLWRRSRMPEVDPAGDRAVLAGDVRHYGKSISPAHWERTCDFYVRHRPDFAAKWAARRGQAVHERSDFGRPLIRWDERGARGVIEPDVARSLAAVPWLEPQPAFATAAGADAGAG